MKLIPLTRGLFSKVDDEDYEELSKFKWYALSNLRPARMDEKTKNHVLMYRQIVNAQKGLEVDHINGDVLDNQKSNLRICSHRQNQLNRKVCRNNASGYKGVICLKSGSWGAKLHTLYLGTFRTKEEAAVAYNSAAKKYYGEFARLNIIKQS